jgi:5-methylcytosine-specific restriction protein A
MQCPLCERDCPEERMQRHHLQTRRKDRFDIELVCSDCHRSIHALFTQAELRNEALDLHTIEGLLANEQFARHVAFIRRADPGGRVQTKNSRSRRRRR